jgi:hypothetical protein
VTPESEDKVVALKAQFIKALDKLQDEDDDEDESDLLDSSPDPGLKIDAMSNPEISPGLITLPH